MKVESLRRHICNRYCPEVTDHATVDAFLNAWAEFIKKRRGAVPKTAEDFKYQHAHSILEEYKRGNKIDSFLISFVNESGVESVEQVNAKDFLLSKQGKSLLNKFYYKIKKG